MDLITELTVLSGPKALLNEWLTGFFDGGMHAIGTNDPVQFPKTAIRFGQSAPAQPMANDQKSLPDGVSSEIRILIIRRNEVSRVANDIIAGKDGRSVTAYCSLQFWVNCKMLPKGASDVLADDIAQLLKALLTNPQTRSVMANFGLKHLQPQEPEVIQSTDYTKRLICCNAEIFYTLKSADARQ